MARAEAALEADQPTVRLGLEDAQRFVNHVAHSEDFDPPLVVYGSVRARVDGLAVSHAHAIAVTSKTPSELPLLHELAHFIRDMDHVPRFQDVYARLVSCHLPSSTGDGRVLGIERATVFDSKTCFLEAVDTVQVAHDCEPVMCSGVALECRHIADNA